MAVSNKKIWIDLDNSPHVVFFRPIIRELRERGYPVVISARDCSQTCGLADKYNFSYKRIGRHFGRNKFLKLIGLVVRSLEMIPFVLREKPFIAVSHGSRSQLLTAKLLGIRTIVIFDYEHSKGLVIVNPDWAVKPEMVKIDERKYPGTQFISYPGIKEDVYVPEFRPDSAILKELGIGDNKLVVTIRPPATQAHYHNPHAEELLKVVIEHLAQNKNICMVLIPRYEDQADFIKKTWSELFYSGRIVIPDHVVDGLNLMWHSDFVISGGGTMNREAAALGVPVYSIFRGKIGAVDHYLEDKGRLTMLKSAEDVKSKLKLEKRVIAKEAHIKESGTLQNIVNSMNDILNNNQLH